MKDNRLIICILLFLYVIYITSFYFRKFSVERCDHCGRIVAGTVWTNDDNDNAGLGWVL
jgi:hypothetical protein